MDRSIIILRLLGVNGVASVELRCAWWCRLARRREEERGGESSSSIPSTVVVNVVVVAGGVANVEETSSSSNPSSSPDDDNDDDDDGSGLGRCRREKEEGVRTSPTIVFCFLGGVSGGTNLSSWSSSSSSSLHLSAEGGGVSGLTEWIASRHLGERGTSRAASGGGCFGRGPPGRGAMALSPLLASMVRELKSERLALTAR